MAAYLVITAQIRDRQRFLAGYGAAALAFWNSPEYAEARQLRDGIADCQVLLIEG